MEYNFDKEIDAFLRQTAKGESASAAEDSESKIQALESNHLDADEISAFAENALPEKAKQRYTIHLADCDACRRNLSNVIFLNAESKAEKISPKETAAFSPAIAWYKRLFAFPNLAYTMGALAIVFSGIIGFIVLQNVRDNKNSEVLLVSERTPSINEMPSDNAAMPSKAAPNAGNTAANTNTAIALSSNMTMANTPAKPLANANASAVAAEPNAKPSAPSKAAPQVKENFLAEEKNENLLQAGEKASTKVASEQNQNRAAASEKKVEDDEIIKSDAQVSARQSAELPKTKTFGSSPKNAKKSEAESKSEIAAVNGKTFRRENDVWYDAAYNNQTTVNIKRGTSEYKKLDKNLRAIAETLKGTVVVVWKSKAYRIQ